MINADNEATLPLELCEILEIVAPSRGIAEVRRHQTHLYGRDTRAAVFRRQIEWLVARGHLRRRGRDIVELTAKGRAAVNQS
ncbi:MAG: hypothetical protein JSU63_00545 [Phycisphaerales bacterium]|nr:MAG: hypothetical protein JSU63_00545 [Phycisphaerales bacterium]